MSSCSRMAHRRLRAIADAPLCRSANVRVRVVLYNRVCFASCLPLCYAYVGDKFV